MSKIIIGIDPDVEKSGVCMLDTTGRIMSLESLPLSGILDLIEWNKEAVYAIEDVLKSKATYTRGIKNEAAKLKKAQNVGMVKGAARLIIECIEKRTGNKVILAPQGVGKQVKQNADLFKELTGYQKQTNEDKRDAWAVAMWAHKYLERLSK